MSGSHIIAVNLLLGSRSAWPRSSHELPAQPEPDGEPALHPQRQAKPEQEPNRLRTWAATFLKF
jgi:hypothetical protein